jgi:hypothetical protein
MPINNTQPSSATRGSANGCPSVFGTIDGRSIMLQEILLRAPGSETTFSYQPRGPGPRAACRSSLST